MKGLEQDLAPSQCWINACYVVLDSVGLQIEVRICTVRNGSFSIKVCRDGPQVLPFPFLCSQQDHKLVYLGPKPVSGLINCSQRTSIKWFNPSVGASGLKHQRHLSNREEEAAWHLFRHSLIHPFNQSLLNTFFFFFYSGHVFINYIWNTNKSPVCPCVG